MRFSVTGEISLDQLNQPDQPTWKGLGGCSTYLSLALARQGAKVLFATIVGNDVPLEYLKPLEHAEVDLFLHRLDLPSARLDLSYDQAGEVERVHFEAGAESQLSIDQMPKRFWESDWIVLGTSPHIYQESVINSAYSRGKRVALSTQGEFGRQWNTLAQMLPNISLLFINSGEIVRLRENSLPEEVEAMRALNSGLICVVTCGERGAFLLHEDVLYYVDSLPTKTVVNTTGAGDAFAATWLVNWAGGERPEKALQTAAVAAALAIQGPGHSKLPQLEELAQKMDASTGQLPSVDKWPIESEQALRVLSEEDGCCHRAIIRERD